MTRIPLSMPSKINPPTTVIFRTYVKSGYVIAYFPELPANRHGDLCMSYMHVGQHGSAYAGPLPNTRPSLPWEIEPLLKELKSIGYDNLVIRKKFTHKHQLTRIKELKDQRDRHTT